MDIQTNTDTFYTCKYDRPFKEIFLNLKNEHLLKGLLETILKVKIDDIEIKPTERNTGNIHIKRKYFDALIKVGDKKIGIEVNANATESYVRPRNASYIFDVYAAHTLVGETYDEKTDIIQINLSYGLKNNKKARIYKLRDDEGKEYIKNLYIYEINMDYYKKLWYNKDARNVKANKYLVMLDLDLDELKEFATNERMVSEYMENLEKLNDDPEFCQFMTHEEDERKIYNTRIAEAERIGMENGMKKGIEQGIEENKIENAKKMLEKDIPIKDIIDITGLTKEQIENLK